MNHKIIFGRSLKDLIVAIGPSALLISLALTVAYFYVDPAPPNRLVITTGDGEGDYQFYAEKYRDILKEDGITLEIRPSKGPVENLSRLENDALAIDVGFVQDGVGSAEKSPDVISLGSLYYEPIWFFYRAGTSLTRLSQLRGKRIAVGAEASGTQLLAISLLKESGIDEKTATFLQLGLEPAAQALRNGEVDAMVLLATPDDSLVENLIADARIRLMNLDQAEAISRQVPSLHHLVLPHGAINLAKNLPSEDINLVAPTATLLVRDDLHPALIFLLLKAASRVHAAPGILERKDEFPADKDVQFPISRDAKNFYKSGGPFWQKYLPFWIAAWIDRFIFVVIPILALVLPLIRLIPRVYNWRIRNRIYRHYGELKFLETQIEPGAGADRMRGYFETLDKIEQRVNHLKVPLDFSDHIYVLRQHIDFVRDRLKRGLVI